MTKADLVRQVADAIGPGITRRDCPLDPRTGGKEVKTQESIYGPGDTETAAAAVPVPDAVPDADRRTEVPRIAAPGAAAQHTLGTIS